MHPASSCMSTGANGSADGAAKEAGRLYNQIETASATLLPSSNYAAAASTSTDTGSVNVDANAVIISAGTATHLPAIMLPNDAAATISTATPIPNAPASQFSSPTSVIVDNPPAVVGNQIEWKRVQNKKKNKRRNNNKNQINRERAPNNDNAEAGTSSNPDSAESNNNAAIANTNIRPTPNNGKQHNLPLLAQPLVVGSAIHGDLSAVTKGSGCISRLSLLRLHPKN